MRSKANQKQMSLKEVNIDAFIDFLIDKVLLPELKERSTNDELVGFRKGDNHRQTGEDTAVSEKLA